MTAELPAPLAAYFAAKNRHDVDGMLARFADEAIVEDEGRTRRGRAAIREWLDETTRKYRVTVEVTSSAQTDGRTVVTGMVSGNFPGSPTELRFAFELDGGLDGEKIARLAIG